MSNELKELRRRAGVSLGVLQVVSGINKSTISQAENGLAELYPSDLEHVCRVLQKIIRLREMYDFLNFRDVNLVITLVKHDPREVVDKPLVMR